MPPAGAAPGAAPPTRRAGERVFAADDDGVAAEVVEHAHGAVEPLLVLARERLHLAPREPRRRDDSGCGIGERDNGPVHVGKALFPGRVLDDHRDDVPAERPKPHPLGGADRREEVGEDEDEAPGRQDVAVPEQCLEPELERARRRREARAGEPGPDVREAAAPRRG